ncbi:TonB-dependent receptor [Thiohalobacter sp. IOR34]|uniref:TonB-dependent receptor plug domain-containing protein n=1 Tax=Thiohalobacter sp. IOR34 TaxID=3057176 RepID=UPI0025B09E56|nr:TonB-dependent receptor [Thiohalobacter sp. IOR34]WJW76147.1 TonB-dependent receptor [Thiohalobacter sp. IOR34]
MKKSPLPLPLLLATTLCLLPPASRAGHALQLAELTEEDYFLGEVPVVLTATRLAQPQYETPIAVTIIDRAMIDASGALDIPDLLRLVPGFQVAHADGHTVSATYHGLADETARRMQVMVDGRPVYISTLGGVFWTDLPLDIEDIDRIEVIRGPNSAAYGANAFLGAINIVTLHPAQAAGTRAKLLAGNKDTQKYYLRHGGSNGRLDYRLTLARRHDDGFKKYLNENNGVYSYQQRYDSKRVSLLNFRADYRLSNQDKLQLQFGYNGGPRGTGDPTDVTDPTRDRKVQSHFQQLKWHRQQGDNEYSLQIYHNYLKQREGYSTPLLSTLLGVPPALVGVVFPGEQDEALSINNGVTDQRLEVEFQHSLRINGTLRAVWGLGSRLDRSRGEDWFNRTDRIESRLHRLFGNLEVQATPDLTLNLGAMLESSSLIREHISPRLAINYQFSEQHSLRASASHALRIPTLYEERNDAAFRFSTGTLIDQITYGSADLKPEQLTSLEIGYLGHLPAYRLNLDLKLFHDRMRDRITTVKDKAFPEPDLDGDGRTNALVSVNSGELTVNGFEAAISYRPSLRTMVVFNYAYAHAKGWALNAINNPFNPWDVENLQDDVPTLTRSLFVMHRLPHAVDVSALYYKISAMKWLGDGDKLGDQDRLDLRIAKQFRAGGSRSTLALVVQNALDEYRDFRDENIFDTRVYAELGIDLN